ncbi:hypothetical protein NC653_019807 [Populus alba x Populus x berolinensis]|uniref:Uncharacterized protein n=1 Tax=Populus alba x Populus x berolinensis TaxID=444605 RepID=A0AAD6QBR4_9ROSI|nr:hypothetical protein NC653_019807 [Populus alba x Populus x berolinensis]
MEVQEEVEIPQTPTEKGPHLLPLLWSKEDGDIVSQGVRSTFHPICFNNN